MSFDFHPNFENMNKIFVLFSNHYFLNSKTTRKVCNPIDINEPQGIQCATCELHLFR